MKEFFKKLSVLRETFPMPNDDAARAARAFLDALGGHRDDADLPAPFGGAVRTVRREFEDFADSGAGDAVERLSSLLDQRVRNHQELVSALQAVFFPEALYLDPDPQKQIDLLRKKRMVSIDRAAEDPVENPAEEILFTSNVLLTVPAGEPDDGEDQIVQAARKASAEAQRYWYDHPIPVGTPAENDEFLYGLNGLAQTLRFEKERGSVAPDARLTVLLSVSVTHEGLRPTALPWLRKQIEGASGLEDLDVCAFTEDDARRAAELLAPWTDSPDEAAALRSALGVDGEYGRHYSFLKALPALWAVLGNKSLKATFKIDLDQVFPQKELVAETDLSAFEHFKTPLWGARGRDSGGNEVELGMIAGGLVNEKDIHQGLFTPDIPWPDDAPEGEDLIFRKQIPMAVSTRAEIMCRKTADGTALQRIHVTGGTNGIRFDALRRYRPFTPSFIGRAEDQGYILSVLSGPLRYAHEPGLIMRHDKAAFAGAAVKAGKAGSYVGDLIRLFVFSGYAAFLPGGPRAVKDAADPFTGAFVTPIPATIALLRLAFRLLSDDDSPEEKQNLLILAGQRLPGWLENPPDLKAQWEQERRGWNAYYDALDAVEQAGSEKTAGQFRALLDSCRISG